MPVATIGRIAGVAAFIVVAWVAGARAGAPCTLPAAYPIALEARGAVLGAGRGVVAATQAMEGSPLAPGDAIRQVNGDAVASCDDVERAAAEAFAKGLPLLLAVERPGGLVPVLVPAREPDAREPEAPATEMQRAEVVESAPVGATRHAAVVPALVVAEGEVPASARALAAVSASEPVSHEPAARSSGGTTELERAVAGTGRGSEGEGAHDGPAVVAAAEVRREPAPLPAVATASGELRGAAERAVRLLREVEARATTAVPIAIYEQSRARSDAAIREIDFGAGGDAAAISGVVRDVLDAYRTASEILTAKIQYQAETSRTMRSRAPREMPYFSDGDVPRWVASFPFLQEAVLAPPKDRRFLQSAGRWSPDRAVALLWEHARNETARLESWTAGA